MKEGEHTRLAALSAHPPRARSGAGRAEDDIDCPRPHSAHDGRPDDGHPLVASDGRRLLRRAPRGQRAPPLLSDAHDRRGDNRSGARPRPRRGRRRPQAIGTAKRLGAVVRSVRRTQSGQRAGREPGRQVHRGRVDRRRADRGGVRGKRSATSTSASSRSFSPVTSNRPTSSSRRRSSPASVHRCW